jgi:1-acyl-sn-glycerol-3-phosphate acyltransferase
MRGARAYRPAEPLIDSSHASSRADSSVKRDQYWLRLSASAVCFSVFGLVTFVLGLVLAVIRLSGPARRTRRLSRAIVGAGLRFFVAFMKGVRSIDYEFTGHEKLGRPGQIIIANHPTLVDAVFLLGFARSSNCIVKVGLFRNPITRSAVKAAGYIPNEPTDEMIHTAEAALAEGQTLLVFPEGTRTVPGQPMRMQRGAANVALRAARVVTPVFISVDPPTLSKGLPWYRITARRTQFRLEVGDDINLDPYRSSPLPLASRRLNEDLAGLFERATAVRK